MCCFEMKSNQVTSALEIPDTVPTKGVRVSEIRNGLILTFLGKPSFDVDIEDIFLLTHPVTLLLSFAVGKTVNFIARFPRLTWKE
jgi:hypothetical protein